MPAVVQVVDRIGTGGTVLLDLNRGASSGVMLGARDGIQLAQTELASRLGTDAGFLWSPTPGGAEPVAVRTRQITVPVVMWAATPDAAALLAAQVQQLTRAQFLLKIQRHGSTVPVWLRCGPAQVALETNVSAAGTPTTVVKGVLSAATEPYAVGARVDVTAATVTQDPASGTPFVWDITVAAGDALTPLVVRTSDTDLTGAPDRALISTRRRGTPSSLAGLTVQAEGATTSTGTAPPTLSTVTGDSGLSNSQGLRATYSVGASGPWTATVTFSSLTGVEAPGMYRLLARVRRAGGAAGQLFSLVGTVGPARLVEPVTAGGNDTRIVDLGLVQVPVGSPPFMAAPETPVAAAAPTVSVTVVRAEAGTGTFDLDWLALIPADQDTGILEVASAVTGTLAVDGYDHTPRMFTADPYTGVSPAVVSTSGLAFVGGAPMLRPGSNRLYVVAGLGTYSATTRAPSLSLTIAGSYWPRHSWLG